MSEPEPAQQTREQRFAEIEQSYDRFLGSIILRHDAVKLAEEENLEEVLLRFELLAKLGIELDEGESATYRVIQLEDSGDIGSAVQLYINSFDIKPGEFKVHHILRRLYHKKAKGLMEQGQHELAVEELRAILSNDTLTRDNDCYADILIDLGKSLEALGKRDEAISVYHSVYEGFVEYVEAVKHLIPIELAKARELVTQGDFRAAETLFIEIDNYHDRIKDSLEYGSYGEGVTVEVPEHIPHINFEMAQCSEKSAEQKPEFALARKEDARTYYEIELERHPDNQEALTRLVELQYEEVKRLSRHGPTWNRTWYNHVGLLCEKILARVPDHQCQADLETALEAAGFPNDLEGFMKDTLVVHGEGDFPKLYALYPEGQDSELLGRARKLAAQGNNIHASLHIKALVKRSPQNEEAHFQLGRCLASAGKAQEAEEAYQTAIELNPTNTAAMNNRAWSLYKRKQYEPAMEQYARLLEVKPDHKLANANIGKAIDKCTAAAKKLPLRERNPAYVTIARCAPKSAAAQNRAGWTFYQLKDYAQAVEFLGKAVELSPKSRTYNGNLARARKAVELSPKSRTYNGNLARARDKLGEGR
jgi:tetratricopeptide (TPR) repeat protein